MDCMNCGKPMVPGEFRMEQHSTDKGIYYAYPMAAWYQDGVKYCETPQRSAFGFYCPDCGVLAGVFRYTKPVNFFGTFNADLDDTVDVLPQKQCPECEQRFDIDYPRCPYCGYVFESI
jgi:hypothetical protein